MTLQHLQQRTMTLSPSLWQRTMTRLPSQWERTNNDCRFSVIKNNDLSALVTKNNDYSTFSVTKDKQWLGRLLCSVLICPWCLGCPSYGANFKKRQLREVWCYYIYYEEKLTLHIIYMPDFVVINTSYIKYYYNQFSGWLWASSMSLPVVSLHAVHTFLMVTVRHPDIKHLFATIFLKLERCLHLVLYFP